MTAPTKKLRELVYARDGRRCVACGALAGLSFHHRGRVGMGGGGASPKADEGLTACMPCNQGFEAHLSTQALKLGWAVRRFVVDQAIAYRVPVFYAVERAWFLIDRDGARVPIGRARARALMIEVYGPLYEDWENN
jgi:hypothetical protein